MDKRTLLTVTLCFGIFILWSFVIQPWLWPAPPPGTKKPLAPAVVAPPVQPPAPPPVAETAEKPAAYEAKPDVTLRSKHLEAVFTNAGAGLKKLTLLDVSDEKWNIPLLGPGVGAAPHLALQLVGGGEPIETASWEVVQAGPEAVVYRYRLRSGVTITKTFRMMPDLHKVAMTLRLENASGAEPAPVQLELLAFNGLEHDSAYRYEQYFAAAVFQQGDKEPLIRPFPEIEKNGLALRDAERRNDPAAAEEARKALAAEGGRKSWFGLKNRFFTAILLPDELARSKLEAYQWRPVLPPAKAQEDGALKNMSASARTAVLKIGANPEVWQFELFGAPLRDRFLKQIPAGSGLLHYGGCWGMETIVKLVAPLILGVLNFFGGLFGNYGVAIIFTTLLIRLCLFPLSRKSQMSAFKMQQIAPKISALRERYKDDQQKLGMEQMKLFREHKINPLAGCLPLLFQLPIFIGMFSVFDMSVELRREPFMLWITDLAQPDRLLGPWKPVHIPLLITTLTIESLNLLPLMMMVITFVQFKWMTPTSPDPQMRQQQKIMMFMFPMLGLICYGYASGLSLYFIVNSLLSMAEIKIIKRYFLPAAPPAAGAPA